MNEHYDLKLQARQALKDNWQIALMVALIASLPSLISQVIAMMTQTSSTQLLTAAMTAAGQNLTMNDLAELLGETAVSAVPSMVVGVISFLVSPFLTLGMLNYFFKLLRNEPDALIGTVFSRRNCFFKGIGLSLMIGLRTVLWMLPGMAVEMLGLVLLPILPEGLYFLSASLIYVAPILMLVLGIRAIMHYSMATRVMAETPSLGVNACIRQSISMMSTRKMQLFSLYISFILINLGLMLLTSLLTAIAGNVIASTANMALSFALNIYIQMSISAFYLAHRS